MSPEPQPSRAVELAPGVWVARKDLRFSFARAGGPGGQAINKLSTKAQLRVSVPAIVGLTPQAILRLRRLAGQRLTLDDELVFAAATHRSQLDNKRACVERLQALVAKAVREPKQRKPTKPSRAKMAKRLEQKRQQSDKKSSRQWQPGDE